MTKVKQQNKPVKSGTYCLCTSCGYEGYAYGTMIGNSVSAPWCQNCGVNNKLKPIER